MGKSVNLQRHGIVINIRHHQMMIISAHRHLVLTRIKWHDEHLASVLSHVV